LTIVGANSHCNFILVLVHHLNASTITVPV
jgi:hypothetical protein